MFLQTSSKIILVLLLCRRSVFGESLYEESQCGNIFTEKRFIIKSENYPSTYPTGKQCFYLFKGRNCTSKFKLDFLDFDVRSSVGCTKDRLEIGQQDALCGVVSESKEYFPEKGSLKLRFISSNDTVKSTRGFKIIVTRIDGCEINTTDSKKNIPSKEDKASNNTTEIIQVERTSELSPSIFTYLPPPLKHCCQTNIFSSRRFFLVSPNFPYTSSSQSECIYVIQKADPKVCRLRINILFFSLGPPNQTSCPHGYLEIDGKYICGCNGDLRLFTDFRSYDKKVFRYRSSGYQTNDYYGFVLEVIQDECPKRYSPGEGGFVERAMSNFRFYNDQENRVTWPKAGNIQQLKLVNEKSFWQPSGNQDKQSESMYKHFYFFAAPDEKDITWTQPRPEREDTNYVEISTIDTLLTNYNEYQQCIQWNINQIMLLYRQYGNSLSQMCKKSTSSEKNIAECTVFNSQSGRLHSPGYPLAYPANQNMCYRIKVIPGYCAIKIHFTDFQLEESYDCLKDFLAINSDRYCGTYLTNRQVTINTQGKLYQDINFKSDVNYCGRGFTAMYQQVPCQKTIYPITSIICDPPRETTRSPLNCDKIIAEQDFIIKKENEADFCMFTVLKISKEVCKILLQFVNFNLRCGVESITVDGKSYCGQMSGHKILIHIKDKKTILYQRNPSHSATDSTGDFLISGTQISNDCGGMPPAAKLILDNSNIHEHVPENKSSSLDKLDICNLIKANVTIEELPHKICELWKSKHYPHECDILKADLLEYPSGGKHLNKIRLTMKKIEELKYKDIECE